MWNCCCGIESDTSATNNITNTTTNNSNSSDAYEGAASATAAPPPHHHHNDPVVIEPLPDIRTLIPNTAMATNVSDNNPLQSPTIPINNSDHNNGMGTANTKSRMQTMVEVTPKSDRTAQSAPQSAMERIDTQREIDERLAKRAYILSLSDSELQLLPIVFIESFYTCLSPSEVLHLEQRLCDLKTKCTPKKEQQLSEQHSIASENFMRSVQPKISLHNDNGAFWMDTEIAAQNGMDIRDVILTATDEEIATLTEQTIAIIEPYLSIAELEDIRERIELVNIARRAQKEVQKEVQPLASINTPPSSTHETQRDVEDLEQQPYKQPPPMNSNIYHLMATPSVSLEPNVDEQPAVTSNNGSDSIVEQKPLIAPPQQQQPPPKICINDIETTQTDMFVEETAQKLVDDIFSNI